MPEPLFNSRLRAWHRNLAFLGLLTLGAAPYVAAFLGLALVPSLERGPLGTAVAGVALVLSAFLPWALQGRLALLGNAPLRRALRHRLGAAATGEFVGYSPGAELLSFEGETDQDVGFLDWEGNTLLYRGDRYSWTLRREAIDEIAVGGMLQAGEPALRIPGGPRRVVIYWHGPREPGRALTLAAREGDTVAATNRLTVDLARRLQAWWEQDHPEPDEIPLLGLPPLDLRGAVPLGRPAPGSCLSVLALAVIAASLLWQTASRLTHTGQYARGLLWAGLIVTAALITTGQVLAYLQVAQGRGKG
jgi:hypothetical protein